MVNCEVDGAHFWCFVGCGGILLRCQTFWSVSEPVRETGIFGKGSIKIINFSGVEFGPKRILELDDSPMHFGILCKNLFGHFILSI